MSNQKSASTTDIAHSGSRALSNSGFVCEADRRSRSRVRHGVGPPGIATCNTGPRGHTVCNENHCRSVHDQEKAVPNDSPILGPDLDAQLSACNLKKSYQKGPVSFPCFVA
jgi:hypothetical protein